MLKRITKRDGTVEDFIPSKLNKWIQWAQGDLAERVDWVGIVTEAVRSLGEETTSAKLQTTLIELCMKKEDWPHNLMAGRLFAANLHKKLYPSGVPLIKNLHNKLIKKCLMVDMGYSDEEYAYIQTNIIDHDRDFKLAQFQIKHINSKYSIQNRATKKTYESPQFTYIRMAMALSQSYEGQVKLDQVRSFYENFSDNALSAPTPNYINLGTPLKGYASCCIFKSNDNIDSLAIGDYIAYQMTAASAGLGSLIDTRSLGDKIRGGAIEHQGKYLYTKSRAAAAKANQQAGRGGACTEYYTCYDPEASMLARIQNPRTPVDKKNRDIHFAMIGNIFFAQKVAKKEEMFTFTSHTAPDLWKAIFAKDPKEFEVLYKKYEDDTHFKKQYIDARKFLNEASQQCFEVGTHYMFNATEANRHTPLVEPVYTGNLCVEICLHTEAYNSMMDLYSERDNGIVTLKDADGEYDFPYSDPIDSFDYERTFYGNLTNENVKRFGFYEVIKKIPTSEVAICNLFAVPIDNIRDDAHYQEVVRNGLLMIDWSIHNTAWKLPHVGWTAKRRLNAGIGIIGLATVLARKGLAYNSLEGRNEMHRIAERHAFICIEQSLQLGIELGNAPWMHKTLWPEGWLPIDTYNRNVDSLVNVGNQYDWENLRERIIANGGIRNSTLIAHMPTEASSKAIGQPNGLYPIRFLSLKKSDQSNIIEWVAPDSDLLGEAYQVAWDLSIEEQIDFYAIFQKWCDQSISADVYKDRTGKKMNIKSSEFSKHYLRMFKMGVKSRYYTNSLVDAESEGKEKKATEKSEVCTGGSCDV